MAAGLIGSSPNGRGAAQNCPRRRRLDRWIDLDFGLEEQIENVNVHHHGTMASSKSWPHIWMFCIAAQGE